RHQRSIALPAEQTPFAPKQRAAARKAANRCKMEGQREPEPQSPCCHRDQPRQCHEPPSPRTKDGSRAIGGIHPWRCRLAGLEYYALATVSKAYESLRSSNRGCVTRLIWQCRPGFRQNSVGFHFPVSRSLDSDTVIRLRIARASDGLQQGAVDV